MCSSPRHGCTLYRVCSDHLPLWDPFGLTLTEGLFTAEMCAGGGLLEGLVRATSYSEQDAASIMRRVLEALHHMHQLGLVHCDVKPENICLGNRATDWPVKLIDFSLAAFFNAPMVRSPIYFLYNIICNSDFFSIFERLFIPPTR